MSGWLENFKVYIPLPYFHQQLRPRCQVFRVLDFNQVTFTTHSEEKIKQFISQDLSVSYKISACVEVFNITARRNLVSYYLIYYLTLLLI